MQHRIIHYLLIFFLSLSTANAHESWLLTHAEMTDLMTKQTPAIFTQLNFYTVVLIFFALIFLLDWFYFSYKYETFKKQRPFVWPKYQTTPLPASSIVFMRIATSIMLIMCAFGLLPRSGTPMWASPTLLAPDLELHSLAAHWMWLKWFQLAIAIFLLSGFFLEWVALLLLGLTLLSCYLFGMSALHYSGYYLGISLFLFLIDRQKRSPRLIFAKRKKISLVAPLLVLQILTGLNLIYSAVFYKLFYPNLHMNVLMQNHAFTFGLPNDYFTFILLLFEIIAGILMICGYGLRFLAIILLFVFTLSSLNVAESLLAQSFIYGILVVFLVNGGTPIFHVRRYELQS